MILESMTLENFRPFFGIHPIDLEPKDGRSIILVEALNDIGKTSLFLAVRYCLYASTKSGAAKHVNRTAAEKGEGRMSVKLVFSHEGSRHEILRKARFAASYDGNVEITSQDLTITKNGRIENLRSTKEQNRFIQSILPEDASQFFLFDGEDIQKYIKHPPEKHVGEAIEMVLGIKELRNSRDDLNTIYDGWQRDLNRLLEKETKSKEKARKLHGLGDDTDRLAEEIKNHRDKAESASETMRECDKQLEKYKGIEGKVKLRKETEEKLQQVKSDLETNEANRVKERSFAGVLYASGILKRLLKLSEREESETAEPLLREAASLVLDMERCICDTEVNDEVRAILEKLAGDTKPSDIDRVASRIKNLLVLVEPTSKREGLIRRNEERADLLSQEQSLSEQIKKLGTEISKQVGESGDLAETIMRLNATRQAAKDEAQKSAGKARELKGTLNARKDELNKLQQELAQETTSKDVRRKRRHLKACKEARRALSEVIERFVKSRREEVESLASKFFRRLTNNPQLYQGIKIDDNYELQVVTTSETGSATRPAWRQEPSSGASQIIATSFIAGLNHFTAREAPLLIDTPLARLDPVHQENLVEFYPDMGPQVIILYQPRELRDIDRENLKRFVSYQYELKRDPDHPDRTIVKKEWGGLN